MSNNCLAMEENIRIIFDLATQKVIDIVLQNILNQLPDEYDQQFIDEVKDAVLKDINKGITQAFNYAEFCTGGKQYVLCFAEMYLNKILAQVAQNLTEETAKNIVGQSLELINAHGIPFLLEENAIEIDIALDEIFQNMVNDSTETIVSHAVEKLLAELPNEYAKDEFTERLNQIIKAGVKVGMSKDKDFSLLAEQGNDIAMLFASEYLEKSLSTVIEKMPSGQMKNIVGRFANQIAKHGVTSLFNEEEQYAIEDELKEMAISEVQKYTTAQTIRVVDIAVDFAVNKIKDYGKGKTGTYRNKKIQEYSVELKMNLANSLSANVEELFTGNKSLTEAISDVAVTSVKNTATSFVQQEGETLLRSGMKKATNKFHVSGSGSRTINRHIDKFGSVAAEQAVMNLGAYTQKYLNNEMSFGEATYGMLTDSASGAVRAYFKEEGAAIASDAINTLAMRVMKDVGNKQAQNMTAKALAKYASPAAVAGTATALVAMGSTFKQYFNGEITKTELLVQLGEEGTGACLASTYGAIGMTLGAVAGPLGVAAGGAIGTMAGYIASNMMYGALLQAFKDADVAKANYEKIHEFCQQAIRIRQERRRQFEIATKTFLERRQAVIDNSFATINEAFLANDYEAFGRGLEQIAIEFGGDLGEFKNIDTLKEAMSDESFVFEL